MYVSQLTGRRLLRYRHSFQLDAVEGRGSRVRRLRAVKEKASQLQGPGRDPLRTLLAPFVAGERRSEVNPCACLRRLRRICRHERFHAAMADLVTCGRDEYIVHFRSARNGRTREREEDCDA